MGTLIVKPRLDIDAKNYIDAVQDADNAFLEPDVRQAINRFVIGCKSDGIWDAIKASCILSGARTLTGALIPLVGTAPTNFNFVSGDYNRKTGLKANGTTKYLDSNRNNNADPQDDNHNSVFVTEFPTIGVSLLGISSGASGVNNLLSTATRSRNSDFESLTVVANSFVGVSRATGANYTHRGNATSAVVSIASQTSFAGNLLVFTRSTDSLFSNPRLSFYSIGESLDLALLDARISTLMTTLNSVIA